MSKKRYSLFRWRCRKLEIKLPVIPGSKIFRINSWANLESRRLWRANICIRNIFLLLLIFSRTFQTFPTLKKEKIICLVQNWYFIIESPSTFLDLLVKIWSYKICPRTFLSNFCKEMMSQKSFCKTLKVFSTFYRKCKKWTPTHFFGTFEKRITPSACDPCKL